ncbi:MAG TPA: rhomboid family intramembrane serine protease [Actinocrinis sp.]|jgi:membrane associated rhomboid family serine protease|uniref:rhomboid family intramembrane serine protease n=1 Tax=Actinocrinis sp. TaxID=1920516 RepID=UPI002DDD262B|nr:rhomboid family intramembrane serine protease [Actinocrinis sp.]HEV3169231.1 rhomboid family intramembrane serine protease [Actinocrinis sp.]
MPSDESPTAAPDTEGVSGPPVCFRHPQRETYLRCARCDRSICTDCMVAASVGFHCPECVRDGNRVVRQPRTVAGGRAQSRNGVVTVVLIAICVVIFGLQQIIGAAFTNRLDLQAMAPHIESLPSSSDIGVVYGDWYRLVSSIFVHANIAHLAMNMLSLWFIGLPVEARLGRTRYALTFLTCGIAGSAASFLSLGEYGSSLGASGAIFGLLGVLAVLAFREKLDLQPIITVIILNLIFSFTVGGISWQSHVGGLVCGLLLGVALAYAPRARTVVAWFRNPQIVIPSAVGTGLLLISAVAVIVHTKQLQDTYSASILGGNWINLLR